MEEKIKINNPLRLLVFLLIILLSAFIPYGLTYLLHSENVATATYTIYDTSASKTKNVKKIEFSNTKLLKTEIANLWIDTVGKPIESFPRYKVRYQGRVVIPESGDHQVIISTSFPFKLQIGSKQTLQKEGAIYNFKRINSIAPGTYDFQLELYKPIGKDKTKKLVLLTRDSKGGKAPLRFIPVEQPYSSVVIVLASLCALFLLLAAYYREILIRLFSRKEQLFLLSLFVFSLAFSLRFADYDLVPYFLETADEYNNAWIGHTLLRDGSPSGWGLSSMIGKGEKRVWMGNHFNITNTKLHPMPTYAIFNALFLKLSVSPDTIYQISLTSLRMFPVLLSSIAVILVFLIGVRLAGIPHGLISSVLYAVYPHAVLSGRLAKDDNLLVCFALLVLLLLLKFRDYKALSKGQSIGFSFLVGISAVIKQTGVFIPGLVCVVLAERKSWKLLSLVLFSTVLFYALYVFYGFYYSWEQFTRQLSYMSSLSPDYSFVYKYFTKGVIVQSSFFAGPLIWLWVAFFSQFSAQYKEEKSRYVELFVVLYLSVLVLARMDGDIYGWYFIVLYPFLAISAGRFIISMYQEVSLPKFIVTLFLLGAGFLVTYQVENMLSTHLARVFIVGSILPFVFHYMFKDRFTRFVARSVAVIFFLLITLASMNIDVNSTVFY